MKNTWTTPEIEALSIEQTANNVVINTESDLIYADEKTGRPDGYECRFSCN